MSKTNKPIQAIDRYRPLGRIYSVILSWKYPLEKAEPTATDLGRECAVGSEYEAPASAREASSMSSTKSEIHQPKWEWRCIYEL